MANQDDIDRAKKGKEHWNTWALQNPGAPVDFSNANLEEISFAWFRFPGRSDFTGAIFPSEAIFIGARFSELAEFTRAAFPDGANLIGVVFDKWAHFSEATFSGAACFAGTIFSDLAYFDEATFSDGANFVEVKFSNSAYFQLAEFSSDADFTAAEFLGKTDFSEAQFSKSAYFPRGSFSVGVEFNKASFGGWVDFTDRKFNGPTFFQEVSFSEIPLFHGASIHQGTEFGDVNDIFTDFHSDDAEHGYRTLKLAMGKQQARTEEAAFAALELKARRYRLMQEAKTRPFWKRIPLWAECLGYWSWEFFSKSGRSFLRPFAGYLASWAAFAASYVLPCNGWRGDWWAGIHYAFLKQFPFAAAFRGGTNHFANLEQALFAATPPPGWVTALTSFQSLIALTLIFLMGLGIRHKFRLR